MGSYCIRMYDLGDTMIAYRTKKDTPSRLTRKQARRSTFLENKTAIKKLKSKLRRERQAVAESEE